MLDAPAAMPGFSFALFRPVLFPRANEPSSHPQDAFGVLAWIFDDCREGAVRQQRTFSADRSEA